MGVVADVLRPFWVPGLAEVSGQVSTSFKAWITEGDFVFQHETKEKGACTFYSASGNRMLEAVAFDVSRMASSAFETMCGVPSRDELQRSTAWSLIRCYYAAFFAAHAISRVFGECVTQIDKNQRSVLNSTLQGAGAEVRISEGLHSIVIDVRNSAFTISPLTHGTHEDSWAQFSILLDRLSTLALSSANHMDTQSRQEVAVLLLALTEVMRTSPCSRRGNWLSYLRNEINYQHRHGVWFPHEGSGKFRRLLTLRLGSWKKDAKLEKIKSDQTVLRFGFACATIVSIARELVLELSSRNSGDKSFLKEGALLVLKQSAPNNGDHAL